MRPTSRLVFRLACACACACTTGCVEDRVYPGFYGETEREEQPLTGSSAAGNGSAGAAAATAGTRPPTAGTDGMVTAGAPESGAPAPSNPAGDGCDLTGRWLVTLHYVTDALGQQQTLHSFLYYEIARTDAGLAISKSLHCGDEGLAEGLFAVTADLRSSWPGVIERVSYAGRPVSSTMTGDGCDVRFGKWYVVRGATYPHYNDPSIPLPTLEQKANGNAPGWEDWDEDGQPGITGMISGTVTGKVFVAPRTWTEMKGTVRELGARFELPLEWNQEYNMLSYDGSPLLASEAVRAADPRLHFAELARLDAPAATGDDAAVCRAVVELAKTLTPTASAI